MSGKEKTNGSLAMAPRVITIPAASQENTRKLRVAAYARVSSNSEDQKHSFAAQNAYFSKLITDNPDWELADIYADQGITGTSIMGNRKQPFGYKMELGEIVPQPQEAKTVRSIYLQYLAGASFKQLAEQLQTEDVPYDVGKPWNKNMVARILEDDRYIGEKYFPALIPTEQFHAAQERRKEMRPEYKQTPAQKELRKLCGGIVPDSVARRVLKILNQVVDDPQLIKIESSGVPTTEDIRQRRLELDKLLQTPPVDEEIARQKAMELAVLTLVSVEMEELDANLLRQSVRKITYGSKTVKVLLKNNQVLEECDDA